MKWFKDLINAVAGPKAPPLKLGPGLSFAEELQRFVNASRRHEHLPPVRLDGHLCRDAQATAERLAQGFDVAGDRTLIAVGLDSAEKVAATWTHRWAGWTPALDPGCHDAGFGVATAIDGVTRYWVGVFAESSDGS